VANCCIGHVNWKRIERKNMLFLVRELHFAFYFISNENLTFIKNIGNLCIFNDWLCIRRSVLHVWRHPYTETDMSNVSFDLTIFVSAICVQEIVQMCLLSDYFSHIWFSRSHTPLRFIFVLFFSIKGPLT
jgi:hypothetical protein